MSPTISEILDRQQATFLLDQQTQEQRLHTLELAVKDLQSKNAVLRKKLKSVASDLEDIEDWKQEFAAWAGALMVIIQGLGQTTAPRISALQSWIQESPI